IDDGEAQEEDVRVSVRERAQAVEVLLAGRVPERQLERLTVRRQLNDEVVEYRRLVGLWHAVGGVAQEQARLAHSAVTHHHKLDLSRRHLLLCYAVVVVMMKSCQRCHTPFVP